MNTRICYLFGFFFLNSVDICCMNSVREHGSRNSCFVSSIAQLCILVKHALKFSCCSAICPVSVIQLTSYSPPQWRCFVPVRYSFSFLNEGYFMQEMKQMVVKRERERERERERARECVLHRENKLTPSVA